MSHIYIYIEGFDSAEVGIYLYSMSYHDVPPFVISPLIFTSIMFAFIQGKGYSPRDTESGQLLIDRAMHLDVLEYLLWINR